MASNHATTGPTNYPSTQHQKRHADKQEVEKLNAMRLETKPDSDSDRFKARARRRMTEGARGSSSAIDAPGGSLGRGDRGRIAYDGSSGHGRA